MANPRQRSKAKSHKSHKPSLSQKKRMHSRLRKAPPVKGPEALQEAWDKKKTVFQNYAALGLLPSIPVPKGASSSRSQRVRLPLLPPAAEAPASTEVPAGVSIGFGRIIRDEDGNVIDIIIDEPESKAPEEEMVVDHDEDDDLELPVVEAKTDVVRALESLAANGAPVKRHTSTSERAWLVNMAIRHGDDFESMARDRKLNVWQKTSGEIKRMVRKAGGVDKLRAQS